MLKTAEDLWDENSMYIDDDIDSLQQVAGSSVINRTQFLKAFEEFEKQSIDKVLVKMMEENPVKFVQYALTVIGRDIQKSTATDFKFSQESTLEDGKRFEIKVVGTIKEVSK
jgi:hypothetical protein